MVVQEWARAVRTAPSVLLLVAAVAAGCHSARETAPAVDPQPQPTAAPPARQVAEVPFEIEPGGSALVGSPSPAAEPDGSELRHLHPDKARAFLAYRNFRMAFAQAHDHTPAAVVDARLASGLARRDVLALRDIADHVLLWNRSHAEIIARRTWLERELELERGKRPYRSREDGNRSVESVQTHLQTLKSWEAGISSGLTSMREQYGDAIVDAMQAQAPAFEQQIKLKPSLLERQVEDLALWR